MSTSEAFSCSTRVSSSAINNSRLDHYIVPLFLLRRDLFFRTSSSLFACMSWISLWY
jgi:hypothetical protein